MEKIKLKIGKQIAFGAILGSIWGGFGTLRSIFWALLGDFGAVLARSKSSFFPTWAQDGLQEAFWTNLGWIWGGLGQVLGGLGGVLYCSTVASYLLRVLFVLYWNSFCERNPRATSLRPAERHNTRGFAEPLRVLDLASNGFFVVRAHMDSLVLFYSCYSSLGA